MPGETVDASIVFLPRLTTLIGASGAEFTTLPLDVSQYSGAQFQVWRGSMDSGTFTLYLEESLDANTWVLGASTPSGFDFSSDQMFFSYSFRLRWFRLRILATGIVTCWAEGLLRGGGSGIWPQVPPPTGGPAGVVSPPVKSKFGHSRVGAVAADPNKFGLSLAEKLRLIEEMNPNTPSAKG